jgi:microcystin-dependent protein
MPQTNLTGTASIPDNSISESKLAFTIDKFPTGTVTMHAGSVAPDGWLLCNGEQLPNGVGTVQGKEADFSALYAALGTAYGAQGELPDCRGIFVRGVGSQTISGKNYSTSRGSKVSDTTIQHTHGITGSVTSTVAKSDSDQFNPWPVIANKTNSLASVAPSIAWQNVVTAVNGGTILLLPFIRHSQSGNTGSSTPLLGANLPKVTNQHNLSVANQSGGAAETAPASIGLNYIIKI